MKDLWFLVAVIITGQADFVPPRTRQVGNQVSVGGDVEAYIGSLVTLNSKAQSSVENGQTALNKDYSWQTPNDLSLGGSNEGGELFGENEVGGYEGEDKYNGGNTLDEYHLLSPSEGFGYGNQFRSAAEAEALAEVHTGEISENTVIQANATAHAKLQSQFEQETQYGAKVEADASLQDKQQVQYSKVTNVDIHGIMPDGTIPGTIFNSHSFPQEKSKNNHVHKGYSLGPYGYPGQNLGPSTGLKYEFPIGPYGGTYAGPGDSGIYPSKVTDGHLIYNYVQPITSNVPISDNVMEQKEEIVNGCEVSSGPYLIIDNKGNQNKSLVQNNSVYKNDYIDNKHWYPYSKPAQAETLVQAEDEAQSGGNSEGDVREQHWHLYTKPAQAGTLVQAEEEAQFGGKSEGDVKEQHWYPYTKPAQSETLVQAEEEAQFGGKSEGNAQEHDEFQYQEKAHSKALAQISKGVKVGAGNSEIQTFAGYGGQYIAKPQPSAMINVNSGSQYETFAQADAAQSGDSFQYSEENKLTSSAQTGPLAGVSLYNIGSKYNGHYESDSETKAAAQTSEGIRYGGPAGAEAISGGPLAGLSLYSVGSQYNGHYEGGSGTKAAAQTSEAIEYGGAKYSQSALYGETSKYKDVPLNGEGFQNVKIHIESGTQLGGAVGSEAVVGGVIESRFGEKTTPHRPLHGFGHPLKVRANRGR